MTVKILFLAANPSMTVSLSLYEEVRSIELVLRSTTRRDEFAFVSRWAVRATDLLQHLNEVRPTIVHFSGHGHGEAGLVLQTDMGEEQLVPATTLTRLFRVMHDEIRVVVLNACYSLVQAQALVQEIDCVIGMSIAIGDDAAREFAASFYRALGFGRSVREAYDQGCMAVQLAGIPEEDTPRLLSRSGVDPGQVFVLAVPPRGSRQREDPGPRVGGDGPGVSARIALIAAKADQAWVKKLQVHLRPLVRPAGVEVWDPSKVAAGSRLRDELSKGLLAARAVVVFVSPELLADDELADVHLPELLAVAGSSLALLSLIISASAFSEHALGELRPLNDPEHPLDSLAPSEQNRQLLGAARDIIACVGGGR